MTDPRNSDSAGSKGPDQATVQEHIFTSQYNRLALLDTVPEHVMILDTTLRDGEQTPGVALSIDDKIKIATALAELGVDVIEAGFPMTSAGERESMRKIADLKLGSRICGLARCNKADIDAALDCKLDYVHTFIATSDLHLTHKLRMTREQVKAKAIEAIEYAKSHGLTVEFSCEDGTRTDLAFLKEMHQAVQQAGVDKINLPDTVGTMSPPAMEELVKQLMTVTKVPLSIHCHNDFGLAVANSLAAVRQGAKQVHVCVNGMGERCGNASLEEIVMGLTAFYGTKTNVVMNRIGYTSKMVSRLTGIPIPDNKPIVGNHAFAHESGIHVHGVLKNPATYEAFSPELVGMRRNIVVGKHSGAHSIREKLSQYGMELTEPQLTDVLEKVKRLAESGKEVDDAELVALASHVLGQSVRSRHKITLKEFTVFTGLNITPTSTVVIELDGETRRSSNIGIGPVDAALNAIKAAVSDKISLVEYRLSAITGGSDALCEVSVKLQLNDEKALSIGKSIGTDIVLTSVDATIEAIDRLYSRKNA
ncbi:MAG: 2-isopropylmalate synthase [Methanomassiliicoccales archaeon PtaU1.Bin124]|nr:MAG: 2-isopropylmalate synthase [Methanomassiliicoccales archaeon PtaU1.Bin124]